MKKKVLMLSYHYPPCASIGGFRTVRFVKHLAENQWTPIILTIEPRFYTRHEPLDENLLRNHSALQAVHVYRSRVLPGVERLTAFIKGGRNPQQPAPAPPSKPSGSSHAQTSSPTFWQQCKDAITLSLMIPDKQNGWLLFGVLKGLSAIKKEKPDLLYATGGPWTTFLIAVLLKKITHIPLIIDFRDPWVDNPYNEYHFKFREHINVFLEKLCIRTADYVIANTEPLRHLFLKKYTDFPAEKFLTLTNGFDDDEFQDLPILESPKRQDTPIVISHVGTLYSKRSPENFLSAVSSLIRDGKISRELLKIQLIGTVEIAGLKERLEQENLSHLVQFVGLMPKKDALKASLESDVLLLIQPDTHLQIPAKLFEYIRLGKPIFAICGDGATKDIITSHNFGAVAHYNDVEDIQRQFSLLLTSLQCAKDASQQAESADQHAIAQFDSRTLTSRLAHLFDTLIDNAGNVKT